MKRSDALFILAKGIEHMHNLEVIDQLGYEEAAKGLLRCVEKGIGMLPPVCSERMGHFDGIKFVQNFCKWDDEDEVEK